MAQYITYLSYGIIAILALGFLIGFARGLKRSLVRTILIILSVVGGVFLSPVLSNYLMTNCVDGFKISIFGFSYDLEEIISKIGENNEIIEGIFGLSSTSNLSQTLMRIVITIAGFLVITLLLLILTLIGYWIFSLVAHHKTKKAKKEGRYVPLTFGKKLGRKTLAGLSGVVASIALCFALFFSVFGLMNICDGFLQESTTTESQASAASTSQGQLYYTEDEKIGTVEEYIKTYAEIKKAYDDSFAGKFFNTLKISDLGENTFTYLTTAKEGNLEVNATNELVSVVKVYNQYKENFVANEFDVTDNADIDKVWNMYEMANNSEILKAYVSEIIPKACTKWKAGEKFFGIDFPVSGDFEPIAKAALDMINTNNIKELNSTLAVVKDAIKAANNNGLIKAIQNGTDVLEFLGEDKVPDTTNDQNAIKDIIVALSASNKIKESLPKVTNELLKYAYKTAVKNPTEDADVQEFNTAFADFTATEIANINWTNEAENLQTIVKGLSGMMGALSDGVDLSKITEKLEDMGAILDSARSSTILSSRVKFLMTDLIDEKFGTETIVTQLRTQIVDNWDTANYSYKTTFAGLQSLAKQAETMTDLLSPSSEGGEIDLSSLTETIKTIAKDDNMIDTVKNLIGTGETESENLISNLLGSDNAEVAEVVTDVLDSFMNIKEKYSTEENLDEKINTEVEKAVEAGEKIMNLVVGGEINLGEGTETEKQDQANELINSIASSEVIMDMVIDATTAENSALKDYISDVTTSSTSEDMTMIENSINDLEDEDYKNTLKALFGIAD